MDHLHLDLCGFDAAIVGGHSRSQSHSERDHRPVVRDAVRRNPGKDETGTL